MVETTEFAPADRTAPERLKQLRGQFRGNTLALSLLDGMPDAAMVLDRNRQVVAANKSAVSLLGLGGDEQLLGLRPGEMVGCIRAQEAPGGCGTKADCAQCGAVLAILETLGHQRQAKQECRIRIAAGDGEAALDFAVLTTPITVDDQDFVVAALRDISDDKRRRVLERVFFHDVMNTAGGLQGLADLLGDEDDPELVEEYLADVQRLSEQVVDEIRSQRLLMAAEGGELELSEELCDVDSLLEEVAASYRHHAVCEGHQIVVRAVGTGSIVSDRSLLRRVLGNLLKNAIEATPAGGTVVMAAERPADDHVQLTVFNPTVMTEPVKAQIFQRSFSTKGGSGRGIGTYSIKLFAEGALGGKVTFRSEPGEGTTFTVRLRAAAQGAKAGSAA
jgi:signal transduction histidine kinase